MLTAWNHQLPPRRLLRCNLAKAHRRLHGGTILKWIELTGFLRRIVHRLIVIQGTIASDNACMRPDAYAYASGCRYLLICVGSSIPSLQPSLSYMICIRSQAGELWQSQIGAKNQKTCVCGRSSMVERQLPKPPPSPIFQAKKFTKLLVVNHRYPALSILPFPLGLIRSVRDVNRGYSQVANEGFAARRFNGIVKYFLDELGRA